MSCYSVLWKIYAHISRIKKQGTYKEISEEQLGHIAVIATHADDESIGLYDFIKKNHDIIDVVYMNRYGGDLSDENISIRDKEIEKMAETLGVKLYQFRNLNDSYWNLIDTVFIPSVFDWHNEHIETINMVMPALLKAKNIYCYQETVPIPDKLIRYRNCMTRTEITDKWAMISRIYNSQKNLPWERFYCYDYSHGSKDCYASEVFFRVTVQELSLMLKYRRNNIDDFLMLKPEINRTWKIKRGVNLLYDRFNDQR